MRKYLFLVFMPLFLLSCNKDDVIIQEGENPPVIELDSETGIYVTKIGKDLNISPSYSNVDFAVYSWKYNGRIVSEEPSFTYAFDESGSHYITIRVDTPEGSAAEEIKVDVSDLAPPVISLAVPAGGLNVLANKTYKLAPDIQNKEEASYRWTMAGRDVGNEAEYMFNQKDLGTYRLSLYVENEDGNATKDITINVVDKLPVEVVLPGQLFFGDNRVETVPLGRTLYLRPYVTLSSEPLYQWYLDGKEVPGANSLMFPFTPQAEGEHVLTFKVSYGDPGQESITRNISVIGTDEVSIDIPVTCCPVENTYMRPYSAGDLLTPNKVHEFVPAPGQFINNSGVGGYAGESTHREAVAFAEKRLAETKYVSLGAWGGYIIVGFDHSIENKGGYDFSITGNQFDGSSEPGIVYVMQDINGNGLPDDQWYELKGSEHGKPETIQFYSITYYRPGPKMNTSWTDNQGNSGWVDYMGSYHPHDYNYPAWVEEDSYTLYGVRLKDKTYMKGPFWYHGSFGWGYADNLGDDMPSKDNPGAGAVKNYFKISDAVNLDGSTVRLSHIDFVKVQTGVNVKAGWLGENSTEVFGFTDENNNK